MPDEDISDTIRDHYVQLAMVSGYFDFDDYSSPVKTYLMDSSIVNLVDGMSQYFEYKLRRNSAVLSDSLLLGAQGAQTHLAFYSVSGPKTQPLNFEVGDAYFMVVIALDQQSDQYERTAYSFFDLLAFLGGISELMKGFGFVVMYFFSDFSFYTTVFSKLYQVEVADSDELNLRIFDKNSKMQKTFPLNLKNLKMTSVVPIKHFISSQADHDDSMFEKEEVKSHLEFYHDFEEKHEKGKFEEATINKSVPNSLIELASQKIKARRAFKFSLLQGAKSLLCLDKCRKRSQVYTLRSQSNQTYK
mmetsp:Transcript_39700/g.45582  ORF Transcript_39700/g.45582 Transcript_39700/m.45582 type:complete len:302 (-) Transcript_39700:372-1277(-)